MYKHRAKTEWRLEEIESRDDAPMEPDDRAEEPNGYDECGIACGGDELPLDEEPCGLAWPAGFFGGEGVRGIGFVIFTGGDSGGTYSLAMPAAT